jgi:hypothetical protein
MATIAPPALSTAEWHAVSIALNDAATYRCASARKQGWLGRLFTTLTGIEPQTPLADPKLETIRQFVCANRRMPAAAERLVPQLEAQGFSHAQVEALSLLSR